MSDLGSAGEGQRLETSRDQQGLEGRVPTEAELDRNRTMKPRVTCEGAGEKHESDPQGMATRCSALLSLEIGHRRK